MAINFLIYLVFEEIFSIEEIWIKIAPIISPEGSKSKSSNYVKKYKINSFHTANSAGFVTKKLKMVNHNFSNFIEGFLEKPL